MSFADALRNWMQSYPKAPQHRDPQFANSEVGALVRSTLPELLREDLGPVSNGLILRGSIGQSTWTLTPWLALLNPAESTSVEEGVYVVFLLSHGCERLYLVVSQGCTSLQNEIGEKRSAIELKRRAEVMRDKTKHLARRLGTDDIDLNANVWRARLYTAATIFSKAYSVENFPDDENLIADVREALVLYTSILNEGRWSAADEVLSESRDETGNNELTQAKRYSLHRRIERNSSHRRKVISVQGTRCKGCEKDMKEVYGEIADGLIDAHHLRPLKSLDDGEVVSFDAAEDFAVLCPNCHRIIHRMNDVGDLDGLRRLLEASDD